MLRGVKEGRRAFIVELSAKRARNKLWINPQMELSNLLINRKHIGSIWEPCDHPRAKSRCSTLMIGASELDHDLHDYKPYRPIYLKLWSQAELLDRTLWNCKCWRWYYFVFTIWTLPIDFWIELEDEIVLELIRKLPFSLFSLLC